jgi:sec-independent protein translocase protein TatA
MVLTNIANFVFGPEIIILVIVIGVLIFGVKKIPELAKTFGKAKGEFEKGKIEAEKELKDFKEKSSEDVNNKEPKSD